MKYTLPSCCLVYIPGKPTLPAKTSEAFCGLKQQHVGVDSHVSTLQTLADMCACENRYAFE